MSDHYFKRLLGVLALAIALAFLATRCHAAAFPYITLNKQTNRLSDNGTALTFNGTPIGTGAGSTNFPIASTSTANPQFLDMQVTDTHSGALPSFTFGAASYYQAGGTSNHVWSWGYNKGNGGGANRLNTDFWSFGWTLESSYEYTPGQLQMEHYTEFYNPAENATYRNFSLTLRTNYAAFGFGADQVQFGDRFGGSASPVVLTLATNKSDLVVYGSVGAHASLLGPGRIISNGDMWTVGVTNTTSVIAFDCDTYAGVPTIYNPLSLSTYLQFVDYTTVLAPNVTLDNTSATGVRLSRSSFSELEVKHGNGTGYASMEVGTTSYNDSSNVRQSIMDVNDQYLNFTAPMVIGWRSSSTDAFGTADTGLARDAAATLRVSNGGSGRGALVTAGVGSYGVSTITTSATGATNTLGVNVVLYVTAATSAALTDNAGTTEFSGVSIAAFTPVRLQPGGKFTGTSITYATGTASHAW